MQRELQRNNIVLLGVGHTNAHVLKMWRMKPIDGANLICVSDYPVVTYSGMMPGVLSGQYDPERMQIDLVRLCAVNQARLIVDRVTRVNHATNELFFEDRPPLAYDYLSIGVGSRPSLRNVEVSEDANLIAIKPMQTFLTRLRKAVNELQLQKKKQVSVNIVGAGLGGIEVAFCLNKRFQKESGAETTIRIICGSTIGKSLLPSTVKHVRREMQKAGIQVFEQRRVTAVDSAGVRLQDGTLLESDMTFWVASAEANDFLRSVDLPQDERGFLLTRPTLQSVRRDNIFVVGDSGTIDERRTDKAGVFAVRQAPVLWNNLQRSLQGKPLQEYKPQKNYLKLINLGDGRAIAQHKGRSVCGAWAWSLKDYIDAKFMKMYQNYEPMPMDGAAPSNPENEARCLGCGGKLGGLSLKNALSRLNITQNDKVIVGLEKSDDAAVIRVENNQTTVTADFFASPFDDPFTVGRIAALNSASDCFAMNAVPSAALTLAQIPFGHPRRQTDVLMELVAGGQHEFEKMNTSIVGGHTIEGPRLTIGFTVLADQRPATTQKGNMNVGDQLILSKGLGTGVLMAALMRGMCRAQWFMDLMKTMTTSNFVALELSERFGVAAMTDVTGFGLGGHLLEMLEASDAAASVDVGSIPLIAGTDALLDLGIESTLAPLNRELMTALKVTGSQKKAAVLADPQTAGGLLIAVEESKVQETLKFLIDAGCDNACRIGEVVEKPSDDSRYRLFAS